MVSLMEGMVSLKISMLTASWTTKWMTHWDMTSSVVNCFSSEGWWKSINLLLSQILKHFSSQAWIFNWSDNRCNIHSIRLSWRWSWRLFTSLDLSKLLILDEFPKHITWQIFNELRVHSHRYSLSHFWINWFSRLLCRLLSWLLCWLLSRLLPWLL